MGNKKKYKFKAKLKKDELGAPSPIVDAGKFDYCSMTELENGKYEIEVYSEKKPDLSKVDGAEEIEDVNNG